MSDYPKQYFAYGSNLDANRFGRRINRVIMEHEKCRGILTNYKLALNTAGRCEKCRQLGVAKANIAQDISSLVEGIVYPIKNETEHGKLRKCESFPFHYEEHDIFININGNRAKCFVYIAQPETIQYDLPAETHYLDYIRHGKAVLSKHYCTQMETLFGKIKRHHCKGNRLNDQN